MNQKRVLIVDDEQNVAKTLTLLLETRGYEVDVAENGQQAMEKALKKPDIILLDLVLPDISGFDVCRKLREQKATTHLPIIILSVRHLHEDKIEGFYLGADDYVTKPFEYVELFARMEAVMRRREALKSVREEKAAVVLELRRIIDNELIVPFFQPIFSLKPLIKSILANPEILFEAALRIGLYFELEMLGWKKAFQVLSKSNYQGKVFLNANPYLIESAEFPRVKTLIESFNIEKNDVVLEITERSAIVDYKMFFERLRDYQNAGFEIAIDDIGGGYASLEAVVEISSQFVKIDIGLIRDLDTNPLKRSVVRTIANFCKENNIVSIAEGIERREELDTVLDLGVDAGQGYFLGMPSPVIDPKQIDRRIL
ncbi:MAG: EAL domain-containing protein [Candidatus Omnitrophica bacterium]|nr:EAL domain-containing protein [Candidatus Omnitrophota bacterium]